MDTIDKIQSLKNKYNKKTNIYLDELSRKSKGASANSISDEFVQLNKDGPIFFISSSGFKRMYMNDKETPHKSCIQYNLNKPKLFKPNTLYEKYPSKRPIQSGEPCGFEEKLVGMKSTNGALFTRIGYINQDGELEEYLESKIKDVETCTSDIIEIDNDTWNAFLKSSVNKDGTPCEATYKTNTEKELQQTQQDINVVLQDMRKKIHDSNDATEPNKKEQLLKKAKELKSKKETLVQLRTKWDNMDGLYSVLNEYKMYFRTRVKWIIALLLFLVVIMYLIYRTFRNMISYAVPESLKSSIQDITNSSGLDSLNVFTNNSDETKLDENTSNNDGLFSNENDNADGIYDNLNNNDDTKDNNDSLTLFENMLSNKNTSESELNTTINDDTSGNVI